MTTEQIKDKPTVLFLPGAWFRPSTYKKFLSLVQEAGYPIHSASYPSLNPEDPFTADCATDSLSVREKVLLPLIEAQEKDVVLVMHSYGGIPGSVAAHGLSKVQRVNEGREGGVLGLVFMSGFVVGEGLSVADGQGGSLPPWVKEDDPSPGLTMPIDPVSVLSADIEPSVAQTNAAEIIPHATLAFKSPSPTPAWTDAAAFQGRLAYLVCTEDLAVPKFGQEAMMQGTGQEWIVKELQGSHNAPFLSNKKQEAVDAVDRFIHTFLSRENGPSS